MIRNIAIVSLSAGTIGEAFVKHELDIGIKRLEDFGLNVRFMPHALKGIEYVKAHPEDRAADLLQAFRDPGHTACSLTCLNTMNWLKLFRIKFFSVFRIQRSIISCFIRQA